MDPSSQNWLGFSLSNQPHLSLFHAFSTSTSTSPEGGVLQVDPHVVHEDDASATDLSIFTSSGPKLEDFLGGSDNNNIHFSTHHHHHHQPQPPPPPPQLGICDSHEIYDSELKSIAATFFRGFNSNCTATSINTTHHEQTSQAQNIAMQPPSHALVGLPDHQPTPPSKKTVDTFGQRTSVYRGVTRHRWTGRYEAHLWDNSCRREGQSRKGRQVYLGGYDKEEKAARAYDLAALKYWGPTTTTNFSVSTYEKEVEDMKNMTRQEFVASLRRKSSGFSRGASIYRGVTRHHQHGRWQARIGRVAGNKDLYLGTFSTQEEAAEAYDIAAIKFRGLNAVTNFDMSRYNVKSIANSNLPIGGMSGSHKSARNSSDSTTNSDNKSFDGISQQQQSDLDRDHSSSPSGTFMSSQLLHHQPASLASTLSFAIPIKQDTTTSLDHHQYWTLLGYNGSNNSNPNNAKNPNLSFGTAAPFTMDFSSTNNNSSSVNESNSGLLFNGEFVLDHDHQQQIDGNSTSTAVLADMNDLNNYHEATSTSATSYGNWIGASSSLHALQTHAKPNVYQTPIFGME